MGCDAGPREAEYCCEETRPKVGQFWPKLAPSLPRSAKSGPSSTEFYRLAPTLGGSWARSAACLTNTRKCLANVGKAWLDMGRISASGELVCRGSAQVIPGKRIVRCPLGFCAGSSKCGLASTESGQVLSRPGRLPAKFMGDSVKLGMVSPKLDGFGQTWALSCKHRADPTCFGPVSPKLGCGSDPCLAHLSECSPILLTLPMRGSIAPEAVQLRDPGHASHDDDRRTHCTADASTHVFQRTVLLWGLSRDALRMLACFVAQIPQETVLIALRPEGARWSDNMHVSGQTCVRVGALRDYKSGQTAGPKNARECRFGQCCHRGGAHLGHRQENASVKTPRGIGGSKSR